MLRDRQDSPVLRALQRGSSTRSVSVPAAEVEIRLTGLVSSRGCRGQSVQRLLVAPVVLGGPWVVPGQPLRLPSPDLLPGSFLCSKDMDQDPPVTQQDLLWRS